MKKLFLLVSCVALILLSIGCGSDSKKENKTENESDTEISPESISSGGNVLKLQNQLFSIPSPIQTAILIKKQKLEFNPQLVSPLDNIDTYVSKNKKALNLGVLGSDLAYLSNYNDAKRSLECLDKVETLAEQLDIKSNIDPQIIRRFNDNIDNSDSLNIINAEFYKSAERYLKDNLQNEMAALILTGGWIESLHFATNNATNDFLRARVGEQKSTISNIKSIMESFNDDLGKNIVKELRGLESAFRSLDIEYEFIDPITDKEAKTTYIKSKSSVKVNDQQLESIKQAVDRIRTLIIS